MYFGLDLLVCHIRQADVVRERVVHTTAQSGALYSESKRVCKVCGVDVVGRAQGF
jgi:hypothetical protein